MGNRVRSRLTYSNVIATLALFIALGGSAFAVKKIRSKDIARNAVKSRQIAPKAVKARQIAPNAVKASEIAAEAVGSGELATAIRARRLDYNFNEAGGGNPRQLADLGELAITARCEQGSNLSLTRTAVELELRPKVNAVVHAGGVFDDSFGDKPILFPDTDLPANVATTVLVGTAEANGATYDAALTISYRSASKTITLLAHFRAADVTGSTTNGTCAVHGTAIPAS